MVLLLTSVEIIDAQEGRFDTVNTPAILLQLRSKASWLTFEIDQPILKSDWIKADFEVMSKENVDILNLL